MRQTNVRGRCGRQTDDEGVEQKDSRSCVQQERQGDVKKKKKTRKQHQRAALDLARALARASLARLQSELLSLSALRHFCSLLALYN